MHPEAIDFFVSTWLTALIVLQLVFLRYIVREYKRGFGAYWQISAAIAILVHAFGNFILLTWIWFRIHTGNINFPTLEAGRITVAIGSAITITGLLCKIRVFSDNLNESLTALAIIIVGGVLSGIAFTYHIF